MIVAVCSDKGSPGGTTLAVALGMVWPGDRVVVEADGAGGDLALRMRSGSGEYLASTPGLTSMAAAARMSSTDPMSHSQLTSLQVPVISGSPSARRLRAVVSAWPQVSTSLAEWSGTAIADLGRMDVGSPSAAVIRAAEVALLVTRYDVEGLARLRDRVEESVLPAPLDDGRTRVGVVVIASSRQAGEATTETRRVLDSVGSPVPVVGAVAWDPRSAAALWAGTITRRLAGGELIRSTRSLAESVLSYWPQAAGSVSGSEAEDSATGPSAARSSRRIFGVTGRPRGTASRQGDESAVTAGREVSS